MRQRQSRSGRPPSRTPDVAATLGATTLLVVSLTGCAPRPAVGEWPADPDSIPSAFARAGAALAWPGATRSFEIRDDGSLYNGAWRVVPRITVAGAEPPPPRTIAFEDRWRPVAHWRRAAGGVHWWFEAVALPLRVPDDTTLAVSLEVSAHNGGGAPAPVTLSFAIEPAPDGTGWVAADAPARGPLPGWSERGGPVAGIAPDTPGRAPAWKAELPPGTTRRWRVVLAAYPTPGATLARWARTPHGRRVEEARRFWNAAVAGGLRLELDDPEVENAVRAARVVLLACRERHAGRWLPTGGPFQYRDVWLRDGARAIAALAVAGHVREARELADGLALFQWPSGAFLSQRGQLDGNGQAPWAFAQALLRPAADSTVARFATLAFASSGWLEAQRRIGASAGLPLGGLLPFAEPRDCELTRAQLVGNDAWALAGLESTARLLRAAGRLEDAAHVDSLRAAIALDFARSLARVRGPGIPPSWQGPGRDWGNLSVAWPCRALDPRDPRVAVLAGRVWAESDAPGLASYGVADSLHGYVGADLGTWALLADRPEQGHRVLEALLHWRDATGAGAELFSRAHRDYGLNLPPHPTSAAALVMLVRNMLVDDDSDTLRLTLGPRPAWWRGSSVRGAPTRWGSVNLEFSSAGARATWRWTAVPVWTALTLPAGHTLAASPAAPLAGSTGGRVLLAPPGTTTATAVLAPSAERQP